MQIICSATPLIAAGKFDLISDAFGALATTNGIVLWVTPPGQLLSVRLGRPPRLCCN